MDSPVVVPLVLESGASAPTYATTGAAGMDVRCLESFELLPGERKAVPTGLRFAVPDGYEIQARPRSGLAMKHGIAMVNAPGTIDSDFRGEVRVLLINLGENVVTFDKGDRIAQFVLCPVARCDWQQVARLEESERGEGGFGSTGVAS
ncbi:dUTP diphosphatase [bacterium]|nr:MAG: dUTP diphosphatase [bacterium]